MRIGTNESNMLRRGNKGPDGDKGPSGDKGPAGDIGILRMISGTSTTPNIKASNESTLTIPFTPEEQNILSKVSINNFKVFVSPRMTDGSFVALSVTSCNTEQFTGILFFHPEGGHKDDVSLIVDYFIS